MIGTFKGREIKEDKNGNAYYRVKTDQKPDGEEYPIAFNAFNSEHSKFADIAKALPEGAKIDFEVEKDGKFWNLKSLKLADPQAQAEQAVEQVFPGSQVETPSYDSRETNKQLSINALSIFASVVKGSGVPLEEIDKVMEECYRVGKKVYRGDYLSEIPF